MKLACVSVKLPSATLSSTYRDKSTDDWISLHIGIPSSLTGTSFGGGGKKLKSLLMMNIERHIHEQGMTQQQAAEKMGVIQPRISDLVRGKMDRFTIDMLVNMLAALGLYLNVQFRKTV